MPPDRMEPDPQAVLEERRRLDQLRVVIDVACALLRQAQMTRVSANDIAARARLEALLLFPDKAEVFDLVIAPRLRRIIGERWPLIDRRGPSWPASARDSSH
jgi:hypothetical protein